MTNGVLRSSADVAALAARAGVASNLGGFVQPKNAVLLSAPYSFGVDSADFIRVRLWPYPIRSWGAGSLTFDLVVRTVRLDGTGQVNVLSMAPTSFNTVSTYAMTLEAGAIQTVALEFTGGIATTFPGQIYAIVDLVRGTPEGATKTIGTFLAGYIYPGQPMTWPGTPIEGALSGPGYLNHYNGGVVAGNEYAFTMPNGLFWRPRALYIVYAADATVASRRIRLQLQVDGVTGGLYSSPQDITAGQTVGTVWMPGAALGVGSALRDGVAPFPEGLILRGGDQILTSTVARQAGDAFTEFKLLADQYIEPLS